MLPANEKLRKGLVLAQVLMELSDDLDAPMTRRTDNQIHYCPYLLFR